MPEKLREYFYLSQIGLGALFLAIAWFTLRPREGESRFRIREADRKPGPGATRAGMDDASLADAKIRRKPAPLSLPGVRLEGTPFEILGIRQDATEAEIQRAYRELIKRYHPDRVGAASGTQAWKDAQKVAEIINRARDEALKKIQRKRS